MNSMIVRGKVFKYGDNINTDIISPPQYMELSVAEAAKYTLSALDPEFAGKVRKGDILVAGVNFGSGSSRETSPLTLRYLGVGAIVAKFFARIFYRNAINIGLPVVESAPSSGNLTLTTTGAAIMVPDGTQFVVVVDAEPPRLLFIPIKEGVTEKDVRSVELKGQK